MTGPASQEENICPATVLLTMLGTGNYQSVCYALDGLVSKPTRFAPVAALDLLAQAGVPVSHVRVLLTAEAADQHLGPLQAEITALSRTTTFEPLLIPLGSDETELWTIFDRASSAADGPVILDVTHGFRSTPLVAVSALRFVTETNNVPAPRVLYGAWEARNAKNVAPMFDLSVITHMDRWARAISDLEKDLDPRALATLIEDRRREIHLHGNDLHQLRQLGSSIRAGLPLEAGLAAARLHKSDLVARLRNIAPPATRLARSLDQTILSLLVPARHYKKTSVVLDQAEQDRQRRVIDHALDVFDMGTAYRLAREWVVNRALLASGHASKWLERPARVGAEASLGATYLRSRSSEAAPLQQLFDLRNSLSHGGFQNVELKPAQMANDFRSAWAAVQAMPDEAFALMPTTGALTPGAAVAVALSDSRSAQGQAILAYAAARDPQVEVKLVAVAHSQPRAGESLAAACHGQALALERDLALGEKCTVLVQMGGMAPILETVAHELALILGNRGHRVRRLVPLEPSSTGGPNPGSSSCLEIDAS